MAIAPMDKLSIAGLSQERTDIMRYLMKRGFVQIDDNSPLTLSEEYNGVLKSVQNPGITADLEERLSHIQSAIITLKKYDNTKKKMFASKNGFNPDADIEGTFEDITQVLSLSQELNAQKPLETSLNAQKNQYLPWVGFDVPLSEMKTQLTKVFLGTVPKNVDINAIRGRFSEEGVLAVAGVVSTDGMFHYIFCLALQSDYDKAVDILKDFRFILVSLSGDKTAKAIIADIDNELKSISNRKKEIESSLTDYAKNIPQYENMYDQITISYEHKKESDKLVGTDSAFYLSGFLPADCTDTLKSELAKDFTCYVETEHGNKDEGYPVLLRNNRVFTPFEMITNMFSPPSVNDVDPNPVVGIFYMMFFGIMLGDLAYGIVLALGCGLFVLKTKPPKGQQNLIKLLGLCGISTAIFGALMGSFLGGAIPMPALLDPTKDVMLLMGVSMLLGILHIFVGMGVKGYRMIKEGHVIGAIVDTVSWYLFIGGVVMSIMPVAVPGMEAGASVGMYLLIAGAALLVLTQGRAKKGIIGKAIGGVSSLYGLINYIADILSYTRIMALCLTTAVISQVINLLGAMAGPVPAIVIGILGHGVNFSINALGTYVHTSRLHYVEFFGKFYEGGGKLFAPFKERTKYTVIN